MRLMIAFARVCTALNVTQGESMPTATRKTNMAACASPIDVIIGSQLTNDAMAQAEPTESNVADLRNERNFPTFANCPEREVDLKFFDVIDDEILKPKYHWCLLAEVTQVNLTKESDVVILRDKAGHRLPMLLSIPDKCYDLKDISEEAENLKHRFRAGKCVVILYPIRHNFLSGDVGIRLAIESWAKVSSHHVKRRKEAC